MSWKKFYASVPNDDDRAQSIEIVSVGYKVTIEGKHYLEVFAVDIDSGEEYNGVEKRENMGILIPEGAEIQFDAKTFRLTGGRMSTTNNSYANDGYDWGFTARPARKTPVGKLELVA